MRRWNESRWIRRTLITLSVLLLGIGIVIAAANVWVLSRTRGAIESQLDQCVPRPVGIVFGTTHWSAHGGRNPHFEARMSAAAELIRSRHVQHLLLSGDNRTRYYNEPITMWRDLRGRAVHDRDMTLDYAGFSTFDTLVRAQEVFGVKRAMLITQAWHLPRALYIADALGMDVTGCAVPTGQVSGLWRLEVREWLARVGVLGDLYLWHRQPYFLGPKEPLPLLPSSSIDDVSGFSSAGDKVRESAHGSLSSSAR